MTPPTAAPQIAGFGILEAVLVFVVVTLLFGAKKLPLLARGIGLGIRNFKGELKEPTDRDEE